MSTAQALRTDTQQTPGTGAQDYARVAAAIEFLSENWRDHPPLEAVAAKVGLSPAHFQRLFTRWAGISPKQFVQAITIDNARAVLRDSASVLDASYEVGLSGPGRLHDLFVSYEAMTPGDYKAGGDGLEIAYGFHDSPFGLALAMVTDRGLAGLAFADDDEEDRIRALADMKARWPSANFVEDPARTASYVAKSFNPQGWSRKNPLKVVLIGNDFDVTVWRTLLRIPTGSMVSYSDVATHIGNPRAVRAVGSSVGRNPIPFVIPCHRVLRKSGELGGYHWGLTRKQAIIGWESAQVSQQGSTM